LANLMNQAVIKLYATYELWRAMKVICSHRGEEPEIFLDIYGKTML